MSLTKGEETQGGSEQTTGGTNGEHDPTAPAPFAADPRLLVREKGIRGYGQLFVQRLRGGELGSLPVIVGLIVIALVFQLENSSFLSANNLTNLTLQIAATGTIAVGVFLVLLLGEIDLSVGVVSGVTSAVMAVLAVNHGWNPVVAIIAALVVGAAIGAFQGSMFTFFGVPSFVVTLAGLIGWQGAQLKVLGTDGSINLPDDAITKLTSTFFTAGTGWALVVVVVVLYVLAQLNEVRARRRAGLPPRPLVEVVARTVVLAAALAVAMAVFQNDRGLPLAVLIFLAFVVIFDLITRKTTYGRHIYAVGGSVEAARRAGIRVWAIRLSVFTLASTMAAAGGILEAARETGVTQSSGGSDVLLDAIAAAVIGGTSLFGGRGRAYSALLGILVIGAISNGMDLLGLDVSVKFIITGAVLLAAVLLDSVSRRGRQSSGRG